MAWECAECNTPQGTIDAACHHCGKPLCHEDRVVILDDAFASLPGQRQQAAVHCRACRRKYHAGAISQAQQ
jgi:hypothetical protein